jgi:diaminopimelate decarboxylase
MATRQVGTALGEGASAAWALEDERWFWLRDGLAIDRHRLVIAGHDAERLARESGTPLYVYDVDRIGAKVRDLRGALERAGLDGRVRFALKACHHPEAMASIRAAGGEIDACSPAEVELAIDQGFHPDQVGLTGTNMTDGDFDRAIACGVHVNVDLLSQLRRYGRRAGGGAVGLRVNPRGAGTYGGSGESLYSGSRPTKFGIYAEHLEEAVAIAGAASLEIDTVHMHVGDGFLTAGLEGFELALERLAEIAQRLIDAGCPIREVNTGGGLGLPQQPGDRPLDIEAYAAALARQLGRLGVTVACEPGDYLVKDSAILLAEVVTVEDRLGTTFVGLDVGWNAMPDRFIYGILHDIVLCRSVDGPVDAMVTVAGHINEGDDLFAEGHPMPAVEEGDIVAIMDVGGYHQGMSSTHCLRPRPPTRFLGG